MNFLHLLEEKQVMQFCHNELRILQNCCLTCHFQIDVISKRIKLETWDCAQMKGLSSGYRLVISSDLLHGYLGQQIPKTMGCVFFFNSRSITSGRTAAFPRPTSRL